MHLRDLPCHAALTGNYGTGITVAASGFSGGLFGTAEFSQLSTNRVISATLIGETSSANTLGGIVGRVLATPLSDNYAIDVTLTGGNTNNSNWRTGGLCITKKLIL